MGFREAWQERREQAVVELQQASTQAREQWLGRRVWVWAEKQRFLGSRVLEWQYGEVVSVDDRGWVLVMYDYTEQDQPVYHLVYFADLGRLVVLAE